MSSRYTVCRICKSGAEVKLPPPRNEEERLKSLLWAYEQQQRGTPWIQILHELGHSIPKNTITYQLAHIAQTLEPDTPEPTFGKLAVLFWGRQGSGKSLAATYFARKDFDTGRRVFYWPRQMAVKFGTPVTFEQLLSMGEELRGAHVILDELHVIASKYRGGSAASYELKKVCTQLRKLGVNVSGTTNSPGETDDGVVAQFDIDVRCKFNKKKDQVLLRVRDTQQQYGQSTLQSAKGRRYGGGMDRRVRILRKIQNASSIFGQYEHLSIADSMEVWQLSAERLHEKAGGSYKQVRREAMIQWLRGKIPAYIEQGFSEVVPALLAAQVDVDGSPATTKEIEDACKAVGLDKVARTDRYALPEDAGMWSRGVA